MQIASTPSVTSAPRYDQEDSELLMACPARDVIVAFWRPWCARIATSARSAQSLAILHLAAPFADTEILLLHQRALSAATASNRWNNGHQTARSAQGAISASSQHGSVDTAGAAPRPCACIHDMAKGAQSVIDASTSGYPNAANARCASDRHPTSLRKPFARSVFPEADPRFGAHVALGQDSSTLNPLNASTAH